MTDPLALRVQGTEAFAEKTTGELYKLKDFKALKERGRKAFQLRELHERV